jgi:metallo-beta-lactamase class B
VSQLQFTAPGLSLSSFCSMIRHARRLWRPRDTADAHFWPRRARRIVGASKTLVSGDPMSPRILCAALLAALGAGAVPATAADVRADRPHVCDPCDEWNEPHEAFNVFGNTFYVGTAGLGAILITAPTGHILIDGGLPQSAPLIAENIRQAGFRLEDVKLIVNSHTHYDHAGGIAALQRASGARVAASPLAKRALEHGGPLGDDPQFAFGPEHNDYARVPNVRIVNDGETVRIGPLAITAHFTPGHTPGGTTWTWKSCEGERCLDLVYADSLNSVSAPGFRFTGDGKQKSRVAQFERSMEVVAKLPCDILLAPHPILIDMEKKLQLREVGTTPDPFIDTGACKAYADAARARLATRVAEETK